MCKVNELLNTEKGEIELKQIELSKLKDSDYVCNEYGMLISVGELRESMESDEATTTGWFLAEKRTWVPDARYMLENYIDNEKDDMYEGWEDNALACVNKEANKEWIYKLDKLLAELFDDSVRTYFEGTQEIDTTKTESEE